jgi:hypothetical protein
MITASFRQVVYALSDALDLVGVMAAPYSPVVRSSLC